MKTVRLLSGAAAQNCGSRLKLAPPSAPQNASPWELPKMSEQAIESLEPKQGKPVLKEIMLFVSATEPREGTKSLKNTPATAGVPCARFPMIVHRAIVAEASLLTAMAAP